MRALPLQRGAAIGLLILALSATPARATLIDNLDGTVLDDVSGLVWTKNANLAASNTFGVGGIAATGRMTWDTAQAWIAAMNAANYLGFNDWRLHTITDTGAPGCDFAFTGTDCGYNVDLGTGELADLWYRALGNIPYYDTSGNGPQAGWGLTNTGPFDNMQSDYYWSGTEYAPSTVNAWTFHTDRGYQDLNLKTNLFYGWAVRTGNAGVPLPGTALLLGLGLLGLTARRRLA
ncbi:MAG: DUF1566 domain-containing protein [Chromatiales bacterium]|nr:DUF1566 domain-containing protein [Chromatiales bacterium]